MAQSDTNLVLEAIKLNEQAVRTIDTKASILIAAVIFGINSVLNASSLLGHLPQNLSYFSVLPPILTGICLIQLMAVAAPVRTRHLPTSNFLFSHTPRSAETIQSALADQDPTVELCKELSELEHIRSIKLKRMRSASYSAVVVVSIITAQIAISYGLRISVTP